MRDLLLDDDFVLNEAGYCRLASPVESVRQEIGRLVEEGGWVSAPMTAALAQSIQADVLSLLRSHPDVQTPGSVDIVTEDGQVYVQATFDGQQTEVSL